MALVLDASICGSWMLPDESHPLGVRALHRLVDEEAHVPGIWWFEVRNLLLVNERKGRGSVENTAAVLNDLKQLHIVEDTAPHSDAILNLAREHRLTFYDAAYLDLALRRGLTLATLDGRLAEAARAVGVRLLEEG